MIPFPFVCDICSRALGESEVQLKVDHNDGTGLHFYCVNCMSESDAWEYVANAQRRREVLH